MATKAIPVVAAKVAATLSDFPVYIKPSAMTGWGSLTTAEANSIRFYSDSGLTTELAREVVSADEIHVKVPSLTTTTTIYADYDGIRADYAVGATYGRNAVWSDYVGVFHLGDTTDSTGNNTPSNTGVTFTSGVLGDEAVYNANTDRIIVGSDTAYQFGEADAFTIQGWFNLTTLAASEVMFGRQDGAGTADFRGYSLRSRDTSGGLRWDHFSDLGSGGFNQVDFLSVMSASTNSLIHLRNSGTGGASGISLYYNGSSQTATVNGDTLTGSTAITRDFEIGNRDGSNLGWNGTIDELRVRATELSANWITTEYNNQDDVGAFWGTVTDAGGVTANNSARRMVMFM